MESINLNHVQHLMSLRATVTQSHELTFSDSDLKANPKTGLDRVTLSPALYQADLSSSRFSSMEEQSASKTKQVNSWLTLDELESGVRKPFKDAEDARLSTLTLAELMEEIKNLPNVDKNGHLKSAFAGTEQGDRLGSAAANIKIQAQFNFERASENVSQTLSGFQEFVESELGISPDQYRVKYINGEIMVVSAGESSLNNSAIHRIQDLLDDPEGHDEAVKLMKDIISYNDAAAELINNRLIRATGGSNQNQYLPESLSVDEIMNGVDYSNADGLSHLHGKWLDVVAGANESFKSALSDGSHLEKTMDSGVLELTKLRESLK